jgi:hypothetical protein
MIKALLHNNCVVSFEEKNHNDHDVLAAVPSVVAGRVAALYHAR